MRLVKILCILGIFFAIFPLMAQDRSYQFASGASGITLSNNTDYGFTLDVSVNNYQLSETQTKGGLYDQLFIEGFGPGNRIGEASLPMLSRIVAVPVGARVSFQVLEQEEIHVSARDSGLKRQILPAQPPISKSADINSLIFEKNQSFYRQNTFSQNPLFRIEEIGYMRGLRLFQFYYEPLRYNPVSGELKIAKSSSIRVDFEHPDLAATEALLAKTASYEFEALYSKTIFNWNPNRGSLVRTPTKILILCPPDFSAGMATYINFKRKQGYTVNLVSVGTGGTLANNATTIKNYLQNLWNSATTNDPAPTYLIIVGDHGTTGNTITSNTGQTNSGHISDLTYVRLNGTDYLPEMYYGRFSVSSSSELANVINKTLMFAQTSMPDLSYLGKTVLIAGADANYAPTHGNGAINYATTHYVNSAHGITSNNYLYPASSSSASQIVANAAEGRGYMNYTAHGSETSWADPSFSASQMSSLTNTNKPFVAVGNCCVTNKFNHSSPCFGEAIIRAPNAGAAYIGGTNNTYWNEDYYWAVGYKTPQTAAHAYDPNKLGAFDAMFHAPSNTADWASTTGETVFMGNMAVQQSGSSMTNYYWEIYSIMGDPSLMPYYGVPTVNNVSFPSTILMNLSSITVTAAPYTRVALSFAGDLKGSGIVPANGNLTLNFTPFNTVGTADLVFSASGKITRQETIQILPASGAYLTVENCVYRDNNNNLPDYNESGTLNVTFKNTGASAASNINATLNCSTTGITITDGSESISSLAAGATISRDSAFAFNIANNVANGTVADFTITMTSGSNTWYHNFSLTLNAPALSFGNISIQDPGGNNNGRLDPGETATLNIALQNNGAAASPAGSASLICNSPGISISGSPHNFASIPASGARTESYTITVSSSVSIGAIASLVFSATAGAYSANKSENLRIGLITEDFETGNFNSFPWVHEGSPSWSVDNTQHYAGSYSAKSGAIGSSSSTSLKTTRVLVSAGEMSFYYKVSSEANYDKLIFYIDGVQKGSYSGEVDWTIATFSLEAGTHEVKWTYSKDGSVNSGSDCAWIDDIIFPPSTIPSSFAAPQNLYGVPANSKITLYWSAPATGSPSSYKVFRNGNLLTSLTALSYEDNNLINATVYSYYVKAVYAGGESDPSNIISVAAGVPSEYTIGTGTATTSTTTGAPINIYYKSLHGQSVYTAQELNMAGLFGPVEINGIGFYVDTAPLYAMPNFTVRMCHTTATDVSSWQGATTLRTYYTNASYLPTQGGYDMLTLSQSFTWNGVDNILVDTAFDLLANYSSTGTVRYTESPNGYRFTRSDSQNQYPLFTGGSVSGIKPNIRLNCVQPVANEAFIVVSPGSLDFGEVVVGQNATQSFIIRNQGNIALTCRIETPAGYIVSPLREGEPEIEAKNVMTFSVAANSQRSLGIRFNPTAAISYNSSFNITNNSGNNPSFVFNLSGSGYIPPNIAIEPSQIDCLLGLNANASDSFGISNTGGRNLEYNIILQQPGIRENQSRSIAGSSFNIEPKYYQPGSTIQYQISVSNSSTDSEWIKEVILQIPAGANIISASSLTCPSGTLAASISGSAITWYGVNSSGWGIIQGNQTATATLQLGVPAGYSGMFNLYYTLNGDVYGGEPHSLSGSTLLTLNLPWLSLSPSSGILAPQGTATITASFNSTGLEPGNYEVWAMVLSNDPLHAETPVLMHLQVYDDSNSAPIIGLPASFSFLANSSLQINMAEYASDPDGDSLRVSILGAAEPNIYYQIEGMLVSFSARENWHGTESFIISVSDGSLSASAPLQIRVLPLLSAPEITIFCLEGLPHLSWQTVPYAEYYEVYFAPAMDMPFTLLDSTTQNSYTPALQYQKAFFKVKACYLGDR